MTVDCKGCGYLKGKCTYDGKCQNKQIMEECYQQGRADERAKVFELITQRLQMPCDIEFCDDCEECCEVSALMWLDEQLHEQ